MFLAEKQILSTKKDVDKSTCSRIKKTSKNHPKFNLRYHLYRISGVDLTQVDGFEVLIVQILLSEIGLDMSKSSTFLKSSISLFKKNEVSFLCINNLLTI